MELFLQALLLGVVEGLTEFLPVSSTGHLILLGDMLGFQGPPGKTFEIVIQLGAILAVCVVYWQRLWGAASGLGSDPAARAFVRNILIGFLPAMAIGAVAYKAIRALLDSPVVVAVALVVGGFVILAIERLVKSPKVHSVETMPMPTALKIGLFQCVAMIPGVSRSGATIMGSLLLGVDRKAAAEFSFFLAIPTMIAATVFKMYKDWSALSFDNMALIAVGFVAAFVAALVVVRAAIAFISRHGFAPFAWYRIVFGSVMLAMLLTR
ncbi:undecaprenyl-diphosphate phosphatase [Magnetospirillum aberrantis]|uniref:Undecaprenyl-diphosphatase n=1 Tax=Magnetospirillum aberrantis SpK TaxID=908842 RepID=A0A7C9QTW0_9PROT|nr:undecaprenyl-diphosphate phosphatase [Magnetospirillum aberrantis]NFV80197.1 undecaprenyl-diphosphate phosphatase [Magnetospirillum aberrantis SpK]